MAIGILTSNKLMSLALQGYNPFQPEVGIFSGGYQGILYPNPTTLSYPGFDPYGFTNPTMTPYSPVANYATGLGVGNPGIDYKNPGHILGILDTFGRMSYGVGCLLAIRAGNSDPGGPVVDVSLPLYNSAYESAPLGLGSIYPAYSEAPSSWIDGFEVGETGKITPDARPFVAFPSFGGGHSPSMSPLDAVALQAMFGDRSILSYLGMPQYLRSVIASLSSNASPLNDLSSDSFTLDEHSHFNLYSHFPRFFIDDDPFDIPKTSEGTIYTQCKVLSGEEAMMTLTGTPAYHDGEHGQNEYRSLTELNSVVNIVPCQMVGATYWTDTNADDDLPIISRSFRVASYMIADFVINVSDIPVDPDDPVNGSITIDGVVTVNNLITDTSAYDFTYTSREFTPDYDRKLGWSTDPDATTLITVDTVGESIFRKHVNIEMSLDNGLSWDKVWLGNPSVSSSDSFSAVFLSGVDGDGDSPFVVPFSATFDLGGGCNSVRMRVFIRNRHSLTHSISLSPEVLFDWCHIGGHSAFYELTVPVSVGYHCHYVPGLKSFGWVNDPDSVPDSIASPNMSLSFTVAGTNVPTIACDFSF